MRLSGGRQKDERKHCGQAIWGKGGSRRPDSQRSRPHRPGRIYERLFQVSQGRRREALPAVKEETGRFTGRLGSVRAVVEEAVRISL